MFAIENFQQIHFNIYLIVKYKLFLGCVTYQYIMMDLFLSILIISVKIYCVLLMFGDTECFEKDIDNKKI